MIGVILLSIFILIVMTLSIITIDKYKIRELMFDHTKISVNDENLKIVRGIMKSLLGKVVNILDKYNVNYVLGHGNLIEITRGKVIEQDDDIDIRIDNNSFDNWMKYCNSINKNNDEEYVDYTNGIILDNRTKDEQQQMKNGIQIKLLNNNTIFKNVHFDLVVAKTSKSNIWIDYSEAFKNKLVETKFLETTVKIPDKKTTKKLLTKEYGKNYMIPLKKVIKDNNNYKYYKNLIFEKF